MATHHKTEKQKLEESVLKTILQLEATAAGLNKEAARLRKSLEGVSTSSVQMGYEQQSARVIMERRMRQYKKLEQKKASAVN